MKSSIISLVVLALFRPVYAATLPRVSSVPGFQLPRLQAHASPKDPTAMPREKATIDTLDPRGKSGVQRSRRQNVDILQIDGGKHWSTNLRGAAGDTTFVSFFAYGSIGTVIDAGGARVMVRGGNKPGYGQLYIGTPGAKGTQWRKFGGLVKYEQQSGKLLAALPVLTVRLDPASREWDLFVGDRLAANGLSLKDVPKGAPRQFRISAGPNGAWLCGLISADENPLYLDANLNGVDDSYERQKRGGSLLATGATSADRKALAQQWQKEQRTRNLRPWSVRRPLPDDKAAVPPRKKV